MKKNLTAPVLSSVNAACEAGIEKLYQNAYPEAIQHFNEGLQLIPDPKGDWLATTWLWIALGEVHFQAGDYAGAEPYFRLALDDSRAAEHPSVRLLAALVFFKTGHSAEAARELEHSATHYTVATLEDPEFWALIKGLFLVGDQGALSLRLLEDTAYLDTIRI